MILIDFQLLLTQTTETRQTYRAILSEPELILPESHTTNVVNTTTAGGTSSRVTNSAKRVADLMEGVGDSALTATVAGENRNATHPSEGRKKKRVKTGGKEPYVIVMLYVYNIPLARNKIIHNINATKS